MAPPWLAPELISDDSQEEGNNPQILCHLEAPGSERKREGERFGLKEREEGFDASCLSE